MMRKKIIKIMRVLLVGILCIQEMNITMAQETTEVSKPEEKIELQNIQQFSDDFFTQYMKRYDIPGAAIMVVQKGQVVFEKGYGYSDLKTKEPFTTDSTYFSIASITKTFTAAAVMKLVEEGKVDLEADIQTYLPDLKISNPYNTRITVKQLLTHTSGIDTSYTEDLSYEKTNNDTPHNLLKLLNKRGLKVISRPGQFIEYSSYGTVVAGAIVEEVSGMSCENYIKTNILEPLKMTHTSVLNPQVKLSNGYLYNGSGISKGEMKGYFRLYPEGGLVSTMEDMGHYIEMFLAEGKYEGKQVLKPDTVYKMMKTEAQFDKQLPGMGYGLAQYENDGVTSVGHAGYAIDGTLSEMVLYPQYNVGTVLVVNQGSNNNIQSDFREAFVKEFLSEGKNTETSENKQMQPETFKMNKKQMKQMSGTYRFSDYSRSNLYKVNTFGTGEAKITVINDEMIQIDGMDEFTALPYKKKAQIVSENVYKVKDEDTYIVFKKDKQGNIRYMAETGSSSHGIYEKIRWYESAKWAVPFFILALGIYGIHLVASVILFMVRKIKKADAAHKASKITRVITCIAFLNTGFFGYSMFFWGDRLRYTIPADIYVSLMMLMVSLLLTIFLVGMVARKFWVSKKLSIRQFLVVAYQTGMLLLSVTFMMFLNYWNLIGFKL